MATPFQLFLEKYKDGCGAEECERANKIVHCKGRIPCDVLIIGEAPGESEDANGIPFIGPAGRMLTNKQNDGIIDRAIPSSLSRCFTNIVGCMPTDTLGNKSVDGPSVDQIECCTHRLQELIKLCNPKLIICVGTVATDWLDQRSRPCIRLNKDIPMVSIIHPSAMLRKPAAIRDIDAHRAVVTISEAIEDHITHPDNKPKTNQEVKKVDRTLYDIDEIEDQIPFGRGRDGKEFPVFGDDDDIPF